ncbi:PREDICTED: uncharacterized protein LOC109225018 isoform X2 [Nicotiana attenuata]|uniref:uncharacterized protein LOC109225018 isoform X2 n=1 Tax=Nicotiana attenuata TaxID=49451 RepID=UPI000904AE79|nr:PREDICTED: uncharacterized protein LOC109225018 isoform X2 [Nicotiana attenuata]
MEGGLPMLNCLLQQTLRSLCTCSDSSSNVPNKWVYAVFWKILPRNYPPSKWDHGGGLLDRAKGNKRNWILVWEDGFCDFYECERSKREFVRIKFGADIFFKMAHEVYNFGEGVVGKVAADNSHKWVFKDAPNEKDSSFICSWNLPIEPQPRAWEVQFNSGIQVVEDLNLVVSIQRKFSYLQSIPGIYAIQRPFLPMQHTYTYKPKDITLVNETDNQMDDNNQLIGSKRLQGERLHEFPVKAINIGYNSPQGMASLPLWSIPSLLPSVPCNLGSLLSKVPARAPSSYANAVHDSIFHDGIMKTTTNQNIKVDGLDHLKFEVAEEHDKYSLDHTMSR